ncbi:unnamed protein product [Microthlaspi erraticum]|uniref:Uncharacterized protein n=1 Tax=Microthlaspi erraticum TaxID=1685480 RepID=A0A6D2JNW5_9BRAS|nr:unnamed protein product [Microthlaspi erraticum]
MCDCLALRKPIPNAKEESSSLFPLFNTWRKLVQVSKAYQQVCLSNCLHGEEGSRFSYAKQGELNVVFWSILEHMGHEEHGGTWHMEAAQLDTQRKKGEAILKTSSTVYSTNRSSSSTRPAKLQLDRAGSQSQTRKMLLPP